MEINGCVHCLFEQSGTFKNEFIKLGYKAFDYDIQDNFGQTDYVVDLFNEIENAYDEKPSLFDNFRGGDLVLAFFPCIYFSDMSQILHTWGAYPGKPVKYATDCILERSKHRQEYYELSVKMLAVAKHRGLRLIMENPWGTHSYLQRAFVTPPAIIERDRSLRGDLFRKPTAYWFINCEHTYGNSLQPKKPKSVKKDVRERSSGHCNMERSTINSDYARNFICDFILGKKQQIGQLNLFS